MEKMKIRKKIRKIRKRKKSLGFGRTENNKKVQIDGRWMADGGFERHIRRMTKLYQQRRDHLVELLEDYKKQGIPIAYHLPAGGMALWLDIKHHAQELEAYCLSNDVYLLSETHFWLEPEQSENRYIRIGFAGLSSEKLTEGLAIAFDYFLKLQKQ